MTNRIIRDYQRSRAHLQTQVRFPKPTDNFPIKFRGKKPTQINEMARRKRQIEYGQIKAENGLVP